MREDLCEAIRSLRVVEFDYGPGGRRIVHPYCHGVTATGAESLRAVQVAGSSRPGGLGFGKLWTIAKMANVVVRDESFDPDDPDYNPDDTAMVEIHCRVER
ncbi:MAG TPA: hypothetical protein VF310_06135 [Vicinamibacteria bacterium]